MKIICRNYANHIEELQNESAAGYFYETWFGDFMHPFVIPEFSEDIHHEIEIIIKINGWKYRA
jgi:2-keto-4-pentenoate hydratase/2-oxohepta-3-ene-1,7-dioic acid hydratase in catechol pathway